MRAKNETSDCILVDQDIYFGLLDALAESVAKENRIRRVAEGWKSLNGAHRVYGDTILRILDGDLNLTNETKDGKVSDYDYR